MERNLSQSVEVPLACPTVHIRTELVELSWHLLLYPPGDYLVKKWGFVLNNPKAHSRARRRAIIAFARQLLDAARLRFGLRGVFANCTGETNDPKDLCHAGSSNSPRCHASVPPAHPRKKRRRLRRVI